MAHCDCTVIKFRIVTQGAQKDNCIVASSGLGNLVTHAQLHQAGRPARRDLRRYGRLLPAKRQFLLHHARVQSRRNRFSVIGSISNTNLRRTGCNFDKTVTVESSLGQNNIQPASMILPLCHHKCSDMVVDMARPYS